MTVQGGLHPVLFITSQEEDHMRSCSTWRRRRREEGEVQTGASG